MWLSLLAAVLGITAVLQVGGAGAEPVSGSAFRPVDPVRLLTGTDVPARGRVTINLPDVPEKATAVALNVTARSTTRTSVTACSGGSVTPDCLSRPVLQTNAGETGSGPVVVPIGGASARTVTLAVTSEARLYVDLHGYYVRSDSLVDPADSLYQPLTPGAPATAVTLGAGQSTIVQLPASPTGAAAVSVGIRSSRTTERSYVAVCPAAQTLPGCARTSVLNPLVGRDRHTTATVKVADDGLVRLYNHLGTSELTLEVHGYFVGAPQAPGGGRLVTTDPVAFPSTVIKPASAVTWTFTDVPTGATAVRLRLSGRWAWQSTTVTACPGVTSYAGCAGVSVLPAVPGLTARATVVLPLGGAAMNQVTLANSAASVRIESEVLGWIVPAGGDVLEDLPAPERPQVVVPTPTATPSPTATPTPTAASTTSPTPTPTSTTPSSSPTPTPTATQPAAPPPPPVKGGLPGPDNTGVPAGTALTRHDGDLIVTQPGAVIDAVDVHGFLRVQAPDVVIKRSIVRGRPVTGPTALITNSKGHRFTVEDSELIPAEPSPYINGIIGYNFTVRRTEVRAVPDSIHIIGDDVTVEQSWLHDNLHLQQDPNFGMTPSHDDNIQVQIGSRIKIIDNTISGAYNAALQITQDRGDVTDVEFSGNTAGGGGCTLNLSEGGRGPIDGMRVHDNVFGRDSRVSNCPIVASYGTPVQLDGNAYTDGQAITTVRRGP